MVERDFHEHECREAHNLHKKSIVIDGKESEKKQEGEGNELVVNALTVLRAPRKSDLARKRKVNVNLQKPRIRNVHAKTSTAPNVSSSC